MNLDALIEPAIAFSSDGIGSFLLSIAEVLYGLLYPANSDAAHIITLPR